MSELTLLGGETVGKRIACIVGESGSGKSLIAKELESFGLRQLKSYTTRPKRPVETDKICVTQGDFDLIRKDLVAYTSFDGYEYGATRQQVEENDLYVVDPDGIEMLADHIGRENIIVFYLKVNEDTRFDRMMEDRGFNHAVERIEHDEEKFNTFHSFGVPASETFFLKNDTEQDLELAKQFILDKVRSFDKE